MTKAGFQDAQVDPAEQLHSELVSLGVVQRARRSAMALRLSIAGMTLGLALTVVGLSISLAASAEAVREQATDLSLVGIALSVVASAGYLCAAGSRFLRFWLVRFIHEQKYVERDT
jgi:hypothetical protein